VTKIAANMPDDLIIFQKNERATVLWLAILPLPEFLLVQRMPVAINSAIKSLERFPIVYGGFPEHQNFFSRAMPSMTISPFWFLQVVSIKIWPFSLIDNTSSVAVISSLWKTGLTNLKSWLK